MGMDILNMFNENLYDYKTEGISTSNIHYENFPCDEILVKYFRFYLYCF